MKLPLSPITLHITITSSMSTINKSYLIFLLLVASASGRVTLADHTCMDHTALSRLRDEGHDTNRTCLDLNQAMFSHLYGGVLTRRFSVVSSIRGQLCFCHKDLCNLPEREEQIKKPSAASTFAMSTTCYVTMVIMVIYMSL